VIEHTAGRGELDGIPTLTLCSSAAGGIEVELAPDAGMVCCSLVNAGDQVLGTRHGLRAYAERGSTMGIPLLYPWANRLSELEFPLAGRTVRLDPGSPHLALDPNGLPIHGLLGGIAGWRVEEHEADRDAARLRARFAFDDASGLTAAFPFPHQLEIAVELRGAALSVKTTVAAAAGSAVPISFGFHPYLRLSGVPRSEWRISVPVTDHLLLDDRGLPTGERQPATVEAGALGDRTFDDAYTYAEGEPFVLTGGGRQIELAFPRGYPFTQLYAPDDDEVVAFEPMTAPTNALVTGGPELTVIEPGDRYEAAFELRVAQREPQPIAGVAGGPIPGP
jgi:galactose mutarotase-like enzyme